MNIVPKGSLSVSSSPSGAFYLDGKYQGATAKTLTGLYEGKYDVAVSRSSYENFRTTVKVLPGKTTTLTVTLKPASSPTPTPTPSPSPMYTNTNTSYYR